MEDITIAQLPNLLVTQDLPAIVGWNRLEARPRKDEFSETLRAEVRDPMWMLCRQWQMGEFLAEDAGSPVWAGLQIKSTTLNRFAAGPEKTIPLNYAAADQNNGYSPPLETVAERETPNFDAATRVYLGQYWLKYLGKLNLVGDYAADYKKHYAFTVPPDDGSAPEVYAHTSVLQYRQAIAGRSMDGGAFFLHLVNGGSAVDGVHPVSNDEATALHKAATAFVAAMRKQFSIPGENEDAWAPEYLEYQFKVSAPEDANRETVLLADEYHQGRLDWYAFDVDPKAATIQHAGDGANDAVQSSEVRQFIPTGIEFPGMPNARFWEFEDRQTNFGNLDANTTDTGKLLLTEFALLYGNDWFLIPYEMKAGSLATIEGLVVQDNFGLRYLIGPAGGGAQDDWQRWSMFRMNVRGEHLPADNRLFLAPGVGTMLEGKPHEVVNFIRDEMANMVWGIENAIALDDGSSKKGFEAATETVNYLRATLPQTLPSTGVLETDAKIHYQLQTQVPENWIPFIPVKQGVGTREIQLQRAALLRVLPNVPLTPPIRPRTDLLQVGIAENRPYFVHEEEVPRSGALVSRNWQRTRWYNGEVITWLGRHKTTGRGEGSSGLAFDQLISPKMGE
jgi:hypothetical protein